jgi:hypothetical protein
MYCVKLCVKACNKYLNLNFAYSCAMFNSILFMSYLCQNVCLWMPRMCGECFLAYMYCLKNPDVLVFQTRGSSFTGKTGCFGLPNRTI